RIVSKRNYARQKKKCDKPMRKRNVQPSRKTATRFCVRNCVKPKRANDGWQRSRRVTPTFRNVAPGKRRAGHATSAWACNSRYKACISNRSSKLHRFINRAERWSTRPANERLFSDQCRSCKISLGRDEAGQ